MFKFVKRVFFIFVFLAFLAVGAVAWYLAAQTWHSPLVGTQSITIEPGMGASEIAELLYVGGFIRSKAWFEIYLQLNDLRATLQAGEYEIPPGLSLKETVELLQHGTFDLKLTFPEGWRREEMAEYLSSKFKIQNSKLSAVEFLSVSEGMEGRLFPETYFVSKETTGGELVARMREMFDRKFTVELREKARQRGLSEEDVVILASIVEREVKFDEDRAKVAGLLIKRWQNDWPLEADVTVQYAVATARLPNCPTAQLSNCSWWPKKLTNADLEIDSPYNTRKYRGLPPTPICNPGLEALEAVVNYEESPYWFYVSDKDGRIHFSMTLDEHNQKVLEYIAS